MTDADLLKERKLRCCGRSREKRVTFNGRIRDGFTEEGFLCLDLRGWGAVKDLPERRTF